MGGYEREETMIGKLIPYYYQSYKTGRSGGGSRCWNFYTIYSVYESTRPQRISSKSMEQSKDMQFNPFRDLQNGGTMIAWKGKNYWFSDATLLGWLLRHVFS